ncbi:MAG: GNAT family N-acetyltransferase [Gammaproteobacteria bacterium]|nr:GNAT family N-acetyltransferase [Gammaproteobacteria bacterium]
MINSEQMVDQFLPQLDKSPLIKSKVTQLFAGLFHQAEINQFLSEHQHLSHLDFLEKVNEHLGLSYNVSNSSLENIPVKGRAVLIANHPLGSLDGLALLALILSVRPDVKIVVNDILWRLEPLRPFFLAVNNMGSSNAKQALLNIHDVLNDEQLVIFFPAGEVSRLSVRGIRDGKWHSGFLKAAKQTRSPILPVFVGGKNSKFFYGFSFFAKPLSALLLVKEMFKNVSLTLPIKIGKIIPYSAFSGLSTGNSYATNRFKQHLYRLKNDKDELFNTEQSIAHPENRKALNDELNECQQLGETPDGKLIYLLEDQQNSTILREIGRLREIAFRAVGEGTGKRRDLDKYDYYYKHLVLWDDVDMEIVGSYRIADIAKLSGEQDLYSETLFSYEHCIQDKFLQSMELGRSFVQPQYWGKRSLDYLWQGIGAYLRQNPHIRYLFGPVSLSNELPYFAKDLMIYYFCHYYGAALPLVRSYNSYKIKPVQKAKLEKMFNHLDKKAGFKLLKAEMTKHNCQIPTLFKQYSDLCEEDGVQFYDFGIDPNFADCIDSIVWVDTHKLKAKKRKRYLEE